MVDGFPGQPRNGLGHISAPTGFPHRSCATADFLQLLTLLSFALFAAWKNSLQTDRLGTLAMQVKVFKLKSTRTIPNSPLPLLYYAAAFPDSVTPSQIESKFRSNGWIPQVSNPPVHIILPCH